MNLRRLEPAARMQLALAAGASLLELGPVLHVLQRGGSLVLVLCVALAYQLGGALSRWGPSGRGTRMALAASGLACGLTAHDLGLVAATLLLSLALQLCRRSLSHGNAAAHVPTAWKRSARVAGFLAVPLMPMLAALAAPALLSLSGASQRMEAAESKQGRRVHPLLRLMVVHQVHYFLYAYAVLSLVFVLSHRSAAVTATVFALGWVTYLAAERLWGRWSSVEVFIAGHLSVAACLFGMYGARNDIAAWSVLWVLAGPGGGTVYCLTRLLGKAGAAEAAVAAAEDIGHVAGVAAGIGLVVLARFDEALLCIAAGSAALVAAVGMLLYSENDYADC